MTLRFWACYNPIASDLFTNGEKKPLDKHANRNILRINVGFLLRENTGYLRDMDFDAPEVQLADDLIVTRLHGSLQFTRTPQGVYLQGKFKAFAQQTCARCLVEFAQPVTSRPAELFFYPPEDAPEGALVVGDDIHIELAPLVREDMFLSIPLQTLCRPDCKGLCAHCGQNLNDGPCDCPSEKIDPRLAVLAQLLKDKEPDQHPDH